MSSRLNALVVLILLLAVTLLASLLLPSPRQSLVAPVNQELPEALGLWTGHMPLFCQSENCMYSMEQPPGSGPLACSECGGVLGPVSLAEKRILPEGTQLSKMVYRKGSLVISVSIVVTGQHRSGIHRPQWCLPSQGFSIQRERTLKLKVAADHILPVRVVDAVHEGGVGGGFFAYWFTDEAHETATHWQRLFWMAYNDLFLGVRRPWAYVSLWMSGPRDARSLEELLAFVRQVYPFVKPVDGEATP